MSSYKSGSQSSNPVIDSEGENNELVNKMIAANNLEKSGDIPGAIAIYKEIIEIDRDGTYRAIAAKALEKLGDSVVSEIETTRVDGKKTNFSLWQKLNLRFKATLFAIAVGTIPILGVGAIVFNIVDNALNKRIRTTQKILAVEMSSNLANFINNRYQQIEELARIPILTSPELWAAMTQQDKINFLEKFIENGVNNIVVIDVKTGDAVLSVGGKSPKNFQKLDYYQEVLRTKEPVINPPRKELTTDEWSFFVASPVFNQKTGELLYVIRSQTLASYVYYTIENNINYLNEQLGSPEEYEYLVANNNDESVVFVSKGFHENKSVSEFFPSYQKPDTESDREGKTNTFIDRSPFYSQQEYLVTYSPLPNLPGSVQQDWTAIIASKTADAFAARRQLLIAMIIGTGIAAILTGAIAAYLVNRAIRPILNASNTVEKIGTGDLNARINISGEDELAKLGSNINSMASQIQKLLEQQEAEANNQRKEKENLQQEVVQLLLEIEAAQQGDLTVQGEITDGVVGSIADAFNITIDKLRHLLLQVQTVSNQVEKRSRSGENSVRQLSEAALEQTEKINSSLESVALINNSVRSVAHAASEAATIAREALNDAKQGQTSMDESVKSIEKIRIKVGDTGKKVKQLAESSQEISQMVEIISSISEKTNLLAYNASVEAARAGEHGRGFGVVADEIRSLAERVKEATKDIQQLVSTIQKGTAVVLQAMETSNSEVAAETQLIRQTKQTLQSLAINSQKIDKYLQAISASTASQTSASELVNQKIGKISTIANKTSAESQAVVKSLQALVKEVEVLQSSVSQFRLQG